MKKDLIEIFNIKKNDVISITGTGGKTSLMFYLAHKLKERGSCLITTSTKISLPEKNQADFIYKSKKFYQSPKFNDIVVIGEFIEEKNKLKSIGQDELEEIINDFDYVLIEADGSRNLPLKFWKCYEPVIYPYTTKTIGVFSAKVFGKKISSDFIYNYEEFIQHINEKTISSKVIANLIKSKPGIFSNYSGEKIIYINQVDSVEERELAKETFEYLRQIFSDIKFVIGSILKEKFYEN